MSEFKGTPGPWYDDGYRIRVNDRMGRVIAEYKHLDDTNHHDGPLLAASWDLLKALQSTCPQCRDGIPIAGLNRNGKPYHEEHDPQVFGSACALTDEARAAIKKALGDE